MRSSLLRTVQTYTDTQSYLLRHWKKTLALRITIPEDVTLQRFLCKRSKKEEIRVYSSCPLRSRGVRAKGTSSTDDNSAIHALLSRAHELTSMNIINESHWMYTSNQQNLYSIIYQLNSIQRYYVYVSMRHYKEGYCSRTLKNSMMLYVWLET